MLDLSRRELAADLQHHIAGIVAPLALSPKLQLFRKIAGRLPAERRIARSPTFAGPPVAHGAWLQPT
jgi:hypothetical protein